MRDAERDDFDHGHRDDDCAGNAASRADAISDLRWPMDKLKLALDDFLGAVAAIERNKLADLLNDELRWPKGNRLPDADFLLFLRKDMMDRLFYDTDQPILSPETVQEFIEQ